MALGAPPIVPYGTKAPRPARQSAPPTGTTSPPTTTTTTPPTPQPTTPPPSPIPTGTTPNTTQPPIPTSPLPAPKPQTPMIPYENNKLIPPAEWNERFPNDPYPIDHVSPEDASDAQLGLNALEIAKQTGVSNLAAQSLADQYDAWMRGTQARAAGQLTTNNLLATSLNDVNNQALKGSATAQLGLNFESMFRNQLDKAGLGLSNDLVNQNLGLAQEQYDADTGRIKGQWQLRNGQFVSDQDYVRGVWGRANEQLGADQSNQARLADQARLGYGYAANDLENQTARTNLQEQTNRRAATSAAAGAGAFGSAGFRDNQADIQELATLGRESAWNTYEQRRDATTGQLGDIDFNRGQLDRNYQGDVAQYQKQLGDNERNYQGDVLNYQYGLGQADRDLRGTTASLTKQLEDNKLAGMAIDSIARGYGIQNKDIIRTLETATQRNNINTSQLLSDMNLAYQQNDADRIQQFNQMIYQLIGIVPGSGGLSRTPQASAPAGTIGRMRQ